MLKEQAINNRLQLSVDEVIKDYRLAYQSRQASVIGRREVFSGRAKFGIFGDGKELANLAIARAFRKGDWRSGYYRDQTWMFALGVMSIQEFFAQIYAHADVNAEPAYRFDGQGKFEVSTEPDIRLQPPHQQDKEK